MFRASRLGTPWRIRRPLILKLMVGIQFYALMIYSNAITGWGCHSLNALPKNIGHFVAKLLLGFFELRIILSKHVDSTYKTVSVLY